MAGIMRSPQLRESPETTKCHSPLFAALVASGSDAALEGGANIRCDGSWLHISLPIRAQRNSSRTKIRNFIFLPLGGQVETDMSTDSALSLLHSFEHRLQLGKKKAVQFSVLRHKDAN